MTGYCKCGHHHDRHKKMLRYVSSVLERLQPASFDSVAPYAKEAFPGPCEGAVKTHEGIVTCSCNKFAPEGGQ